MPRNNEGQSVASMWGEIVAACELGEVVAIDNKFGETVAVMVPVAMYEELSGVVIASAHVDLPE